VPKSGSISFLTSWLPDAILGCRQLFENGDVVVPGDLCKQRLHNWPLRLAHVPEAILREFKAAVLRTDHTKNFVEIKLAEIFELVNDIVD
jgi:hypothetical protein